ncbi:PPC domain-containing protein [Forsythia ovata]|uniref:PPC domain-containing protein n=1 Tax=Forsythia ovata TaxID=205694 RepID=A0ABD1RHA2_9LAMI
MGPRRLHGHPPKSKNKPKPPMIITRESANTLRAHILEVSRSCDVFETVATYARKRQKGICILGRTVTLHDRFENLSLFGSFMSPPAPPSAASLTIYLAGGQGQVVRRNVVGSLIAPRPVIIIAAFFTDVAYETLHLDEDETLQMQPPVSQPSGRGGGGGGMSSQFLDPFETSSTIATAIFARGFGVRYNGHGFIGGGAVGGGIAGEIVWCCQNLSNGMYG